MPDTSDTTRAAADEAVEVMAPLEPLEHLIASVLDHPSIYMGGPSHQSRRKARRIIENLRADPDLLDALTAGWQPIETLPQDGADYLLWDEERGCYEGGSHFDGETDVVADAGGSLVDPTHWRPLPAPPTTFTPPADAGEEGRS